MDFKGGGDSSTDSGVMAGNLLSDETARRKARYIIPDIGTNERCVHSATPFRPHKCNNCSILLHVPPSFARLLSSCVKNMRSNARRWGYVVYDEHVLAV
jgi:hypothetical protein